MTSLAVFVAAAVLAVVFRSASALAAAAALAALYFYPYAALPALGVAVLFALIH